jgi:hypothetical protein
MQFQTRIFVPVKNPGARIVNLAGPLIVGGILLAGVLRALKEPGSYLNYSVGLLGLGILCMIVGRIIAKGNLFTIGLSDTDLVVAEDGVRVGNESYPLEQITELDFMIEGYDGAPSMRRGIVLFRKQVRLSGANNKIHFRAGGKRYLYQFYLPDQLSMQQLGLVFRIFYERGVSFGECNRGGPTFLFHQVRSKRELEELKARYGFRID